MPQPARAPREPGRPPDGSIAETFLVPVAACRFTLQALSAEHLWPSPDTVCEVGPIVVSRLDSGDYFVHNGRHRVIRARLAGTDSIEATRLH